MFQQQSTPDFIPAGDPDFIPDSGAHRATPAPQPQGNSILNFLKGAGKTYLAGTLNAGPQQSVDTNFDYDAAMQDYKNGARVQMPSMSPSIVFTNALSSGAGAVSSFLSNATSSPEGAGSAAMQLLMLRQALKGKPTEFGAPRSFAEQVHPLTGYKPAQATARPASQPTPTNPTPNMVIYDRPGMRPEPVVPKDTNTLSQSYFIDKVRQSLEQPTTSGQSEADAVMQRMAEYAKTPWDSGGTASAPKYAYRVRDVGEAGLMPKGHAQASVDLAEANSYMEGRGQAQGVPQELVKVDLSKLDPNEYELIPGPNGKQWVRFKGAIPESFISKVPKTKIKTLQQTLSQPQSRVMTSSSDLLEALRQMGAKAGD